MNRFKTFLLLGLVTALLVALGAWMVGGWLSGSIVAAFALNLATASFLIAGPFRGGGFLAWSSTHSPIAARVDRQRALTPTQRHAA